MHLGHAPRLGIEAKPLAGGLDARCLVAQRLQQSQNAIAVLGRPEQDRGDQALAELARQIGKDPVARRLHIVEKLLQELVIIVGEALEHGKARLLLVLHHVLGDLDDLARRLRAIDIGTLEREIDEALGGAVLPDRDLAQHQRPGTRRLHIGENLVEPLLGAVDLVDEDEARESTARRAA